MKEAIQRAGRFCALRERSSYEVLGKLTGWGLSGSEASQVIEALIKDGYLDEQRFANAYCHDKFEFNSWGRLKIRAHIFKHNITEEILEKALDRIDPERYIQRLQNLSAAKLQQLKEPDEFLKYQKVAAYLARKGFEVGLIWDAINETRKKRQ